MVLNILLFEPSRVSQVIVVLPMGTNEGEDKDLIHVTCMLAIRIGWQDTVRMIWHIMFVNAANCAELTQACSLEKYMAAV